MDNMKKICRDELSGILTKQLRADEPDPISAFVVISDDGQNAVFHVQYRSWTRKLSALGKQYLKDCKRMTFVNEGHKKLANDFLMPEEKSPQPWHDVLDGK